MAEDLAALFAGLASRSIGGFQGAQKYNRQIAMQDFMNRMRQTQQQATQDFRGEQLGLQREGLDLRRRGQVFDQWQSTFEGAQKALEPKKAETLTEMKARILKGVEEGTLSRGMPIVDMMFPGKTGDRPPDFYPKFKKAVKEARAEMPFARDAQGDPIITKSITGKDVGIREELPPDSLPGIFDRNIGAQAASYGLNLDSMRTLFGVPEAPTPMKTVRGLPPAGEIQTGRQDIDTQATVSLVNDVIADYMASGSRNYNWAELARDNPGVDIQEVQRAFQEYLTRQK